MKKLLGIVVLGLLYCNVGFASEAGGIREPGTDEKCFYVYEKENIFKKSSEQWKSYKKYLTSMTDILSAYNVEF